MSIEQNIRLVRRVMEAFNTGDTSNVPEFISDDYINRESQGAKDSYRSKLKGPRSLLIPSRICVVPSLTFIMKNMKSFLKATK